MSVTRFAALRHGELYRALCMLLVVALVALPAYGVTESRPETCQQAPSFVGSRAVSADAEFVRAAALQNLRPIGATVTVLDDESTVVTSVAARQYKANGSGTMFFRRDAIYAQGSTVPGMLTDLRLGMDPGHDVLWVKVMLSLPVDSSLKSPRLEYAVEYQASELPAFQKLGAGDATALLKEWAATAVPLSERAVVHDGLSTISEEGTGSFERAVQSLVPSHDKATSLKSRSSCRQGCATRYLGLYSRFDVTCIIVNALVCLGICYVSLGTACVSCLGYLDWLCGFLGSVVSIYNYLRCYIRC